MVLFGKRAGIPRRDSGRWNILKQAEQAATAWRQTRPCLQHSLG
ncbi:hypothetical protein ATPR_0721 [Acetobacter tropicalis NBRC 101654]|uniref:Uncharacterized protein n=1 Tax=Acetobacter tropicalis NBRC 101654 TaxID=749388 RepID=F7VBH7_9PROT|nr:hypothetical protein ATPR_0721 [Acetobacter tropicalis NBRC 101654]